MRTRKCLSLAALAVAAICSGAASKAASTPHYHLIKQQPLPTVTGWDYLSIDPRGRRLFISDNKGVLVVDIDTLKPIGRAPKGARFRTVGLVHGVAAAPVLGRGFVSVEQPSSISAFDLRTRQALYVTRADPGADAIVFDPPTERVFTFNGKQPGVHNVTAIEGRSGKRLGEIQLPGRPEAALSDGQGSLYVNIADLSQVVRIDARALKVTAAWPIANCTEPSALAMDVVRRVLFAACDNQRLIMLDADHGRLLGSVHSGDGTDAAAFDPAFGYVFASNGEGTLTIAHEHEGTDLKLVDTVRTAPEARTMALDPVTHRIFLLTAKFGPAGQQTAANPHGYPLARPSSVKLLVLGP